MGVCVSKFGLQLVFDEATQRLSGIRCELSEFCRLPKTTLTGLLSHFPPTVLGKFDHSAATAGFVPYFVTWENFTRPSQPVVSRLVVKFDVDLAEAHASDQSGSHPVSDDPKAVWLAIEQQPATKVDSPPHAMSLVLLPSALTFTSPKTQRLASIQIGKTDTQDLLVDLGLPDEILEHYEGSLMIRFRSKSHSDWLAAWHGGADAASRAVDFISGPQSPYRSSCPTQPHAGPIPPPGSTAALLTGEQRMQTEKEMVDNSVTEVSRPKSVQFRYYGLGLLFVFKRFRLERVLVFGNQKGGSGFGIFDRCQWTLDTEGKSAQSISTPQTLSNSPYSSLGLPTITPLVTAKGQKLYDHHELKMCFEVVENGSVGSVQVY